MNEQDITLDLFKTIPYRASMLSKTYIPFNNYSGFSKHRNEIVLFNDDNIEKFRKYENLRIYHVPDEVVTNLKSKVKILSRNKYISIITKLDKVYFSMSGKSNKEKRNVVNKYEVNTKLSVQEYPNSIQEIKIFLRNWKEKRKTKYNERMIRIGYNLNFITNYMFPFKDQLITKFYYDGNKLIGMTIIEKIKDNIYNLLIRKSDPGYSQLSYYIDYSSFKEIFDKSGYESLIINLGVDCGDKGISDYKTKKFPFFMEINTNNIYIKYPVEVITDNIRIFNRDAIEGLSNMKDNEAELVLTDIPYNVINKKYPEFIENPQFRNFNKKDADDLNFDLESFLSQIVRVCKGSIYIFCSTEQISYIRNFFEENELSTRILIWSKTNPIPIGSQHTWLSSIETCIFARKPLSTFNGSYKKAVLEFPSGSSKFHPTQKPLQLFKELILTSTNVGDLVLDPCLGSGTTAVACKELKRNFIGFDINPNYIETAIKRINGLL